MGGYIWKGRIMKKRFCDLCETEIKEKFFEITVCEIEKPFFYKECGTEYFDICKNCYPKIFKRNEKESHD